MDDFPSVFSAPVHHREAAVHINGDILLLIFPVDIDLSIHQAEIFRQHNRFTPEITELKGNVVTLRNFLIHSGLKVLRRLIDFVLARSNNGAGWINPILDGMTAILVHILKISFPHPLGQLIKVRHID